MGLLVKQIAVGGFDGNFSYLVINDATKETLVVDPSGEVGKIEAAVADDGLTVVGVLITHTHFDHIDKLPELLTYYGNDLPVYVHENGADAINANNRQLLHEASVVTLGQHPIEVMHTPGHIADAVCFSIQANDSTEGVPLLITGDTLFVEGCGRISESEATTMYGSLGRLKHLPGKTIVYPGHDYGPTPTSTIAHECAHNRFLVAPDLPAFIRERLG